MEQMKTSKPYSPEFREGVVRLVTDHRDEYRSEAAALVAIAGKPGCSASQPSRLGPPGPGYFAQVLPALRHGFSIAGSGSTARPARVCLTMTESPDSL